MSEPYVPAPKESEITQTELRALLHFDPENGYFTHLTVPNNRIKLGDRAGHLDKALGYYVIGLKRKVYQAHRLAWLYCHGSFPDGFIDHINRERSDNRLANLRVATRSQNGMNQTIHRDNRTGFKGVYKALGRFGAQIKCDGRVRHLGYFSTAAEASSAYQAFASKQWGEFAVRNTQ